MSIYIKGNVNGDVIEAGGVKNVTNNYYGEQEAGLTNSDKDIKTVLTALQEATDADGKYIMRDQDQWYAVFRVLSHFCGYPCKPKDFEKTMKNIGADALRIPCNYENYRKVSLNQLPANVALWKDYKNSADQYSMKQIVVAAKLMELLHLEQ